MADIGHIRLIKCLYEMIKNDPKNTELIREIVLSEKEMFSYLQGNNDEQTKEKILRYWRNFKIACCEEIENSRSKSKEIEKSGITVEIGIDHAKMLLRTNRNRYSGMCEKHRAGRFLRLHQSEKSSHSLGCSGLEEVTIPEGIKNISPYTFSGCTHLNGITIPRSVTEIGEHAFGWSMYIKEDEEYSIYDRKCDFVIRCYANTVGEKYVIDNEIKYQLIDECVHKQMEVSK